MKHLMDAPHSTRDIWFSTDPDEGRHRDPMYAVEIRVEMPAVSCKCGEPLRRDVWRCNSSACPGPDFENAAGDPSHVWLDATVYPDGRAYLTNGRLGTALRRELIELNAEERHDAERMFQEQQDDEGLEAY